MAVKHDITSYPVWDEILDIISSGEKSTKYAIQLMVHTEVADFPALKFLSEDRIRNYVKNIGDEVYCDFYLGAGDYSSKLYPYRTNLEVTIKITLRYDNTSKKPDVLVSTKRYKAVFLPDENQIMAGSDAELVDTQSLNLTDIVKVKLQLLDRSLEVMRVMTASGAYRGVSPGKIIPAIMIGESWKVSVDGKPVVDAYDMVEPDNKDTRDIIIPPTRIGDIPTYIQEKEGGIYTTGVGTYLQEFKSKVTWFIYPLYNTKRFDNTTCERAIFYSVPKGKLQGIDITYRKDGPVLKVVIAEDKSYSDSADVNYMDKGSGFRMRDARAYMTKPAAVTEQGPMAQRGRLNFEVAAEERKDGLNIAPYVEGTSSNPYKQYSAITQRNIAQIKLTWPHSDPDLLYPGMPCKYVFIDDGELIELKGTVGFAQTLKGQTNPGLGSSTYTCTTALVLLCEQKNTMRKNTNHDVAGDFDVY